MNHYQRYKMNPKEVEVYLKLAEYLGELLIIPRVSKVLNTIPLNNPVTKLIVTDTCGVNTAGQTWYYSEEESIIELSSWILYDIEEARKVIRHEFAHVVQCYCKYEGGMHGRGFNKALKIVSSTRWRKDKHWDTTPRIDEARKKYHPKIRVLLE